MKLTREEMLFCLAHSTSSMEDLEEVVRHIKTTMELKASDDSIMGRDANAKIWKKPIEYMRLTLNILKGYRP